MRAAQGCFGAAQSFKNKAEKDNLRIYGLEGALVEEGEVFTRNRESSYRRHLQILCAPAPATSRQSKRDLDKDLNSLVGTGDRASKR